MAYDIHKNMMQFQYVFSAGAFLPKASKQYRHFDYLMRRCVSSYLLQSGGAHRCGAGSFLYAGCDAATSAITRSGCFSEGDRASLNRFQIPGIRSRSRSRSSGALADARVCGIGADQRERATYLRIYYQFLPPQTLEDFKNFKLQLQEACLESSDRP